MPRLSCPEERRSTLHVVQRARAACFSCTADRLAFLEILRARASEEACVVHAWALMGNHVHLLFTSSRAYGAARLLPALLRGYARHLELAYGQTDGIFEDRYDATPVHTRSQLLACMRYIEANPVRAGLARRPGDYRWSSYRANALGEPDPLLTPHPHYYSLGHSPDRRRAAYAVLFARIVASRKRRVPPGPSSGDSRL